MIVLDPDLSKDYLDLVQNRTKEKRYSFDFAFGPDCTNKVNYSHIYLDYYHIALMELFYVLLSFKLQPPLIF